MNSDNMVYLSTKANTLKSLEGKLRNASVLPQVSFSVRDWESNQDEVICRVLSEFHTHNVIVRSSAVDEDTENSSNAGKNLSVPNVGLEKESLISAINNVIASYENPDQKNQVLIQPMLEKVVMCGVAFTMDPNIGADYYVINYDTSGSTDSITAGESKEKLLYVYKRTPSNISVGEDKRIEVLCDTLQELEELFCKRNLDVEFAFMIRENFMYCRSVHW